MPSWSSSNTRHFEGWVTTEDPPAVSGDITRWVLESDFGPSAHAARVPACSQTSVSIISVTYTNQSHFLALVPNNPPGSHIQLSVWPVYSQIPSSGYLDLTCASIQPVTVMSVNTCDDLLQLDDSFHLWRTGLETLTILPTRMSNGNNNS